MGLSLNDALCRADCRAGWRVRISNAFGAGCSINDINIITGRNRIDRTIWFTGSAVGGCAKVGEAGGLKSCALNRLESRLEEQARLVFECGEVHVFFRHRRSKLRETPDGVENYLPGTIAAFALVEVSSGALVEMTDAGGVLDSAGRPTCVRITARMAKGIPCFGSSN